MLSNQEKVSPYDCQKAFLTVSVMRNSRLRTFIYLMVVGAMCCTIYMLSTTHTQLKDVESAHDKCLQQRDSLSAQLQVIYEHKNRLEKSLQQEKVDHKLTKEENVKQKNEIHVRVEREKHTLESRYNNLLQEHETLKSKQQQLNDEISSLKDSLSLLEKEKKQLIAALSAQLDTLKQQKDEENGKLTDHINHLLQEKDELRQNNEKLASRALSHKNELHLCHIQFQQLEERYNQLKSQVETKSPEKVHDTANSMIQHKANDKMESDQQIHVAVVKTDNLNHGEKNQKDKNVIEENEKQQIVNQVHLEKERDDINQVARPSLLSRSHLVLDNFVKNNDKQANNPLQSHQQEHLGPKVLEKPAIHDPLNHRVEKPNVHSIEAGNSLLDSKAAHDKEGLNPHHSAKPMDFIHNEEHLPQVQPPHSFDRIDAAGDGADPDQWDKYHQGAGDNERDPFQSKLEVNNHVLPQPFNVKEPSPQNIKQQGMDDGQEHGVLIKPPLQGNWVHKAGQNIEGLKRGPQMVDDKNSNRRQEEDGDYAEDGDDDNADDQDAEANEDDQLMVGEHGHGKVFQDADFDDQENAEQDERNARNQEKEEGVMVAPK